MNILRIAKPFAVGGLVLSLAIAAYASRSHWLPWVQPETAPKTEGADHDDAAPTQSVLLSEQVQANLGLRAKALKIQTYPKTITVPGMIVDRPGWSDRNIAAPATAVVAKVHRFPGESVRPGELLFTLKLVSESLQLSQTELFKSTQEIKLARDSKKRLESSGGVPEARIVEVSNQITRLEVSVTAARQELLLRGLLPAMLDAVAEGKFVVDLDILAPEAAEAAPRDVIRSGETPPPVTYELQDLKVELGQQVQAGQTLCIIANHRWLAIEGKAFRDETAMIEKSLAERWPVEIDFQEDPAGGWGDLAQTFRIGHLSNSIDPLTRTFAFRIPLENSFKLAREQSDAHTLWRFRPGQKVRILVRVAELEGVFVLPADAVVSEGPEAFVFVQNVDTFVRVPVRVLHRDRNRVVLAHEESLPVGSFVVQSSAAQLNRMVKSGNGGSGVPKGYHMHADGSVHKNGDD